MSFSEDLTISEASVARAKAALERKNPLFRAATFCTGKYKAADILLTYAVEVKEDFKSVETGNLAIEVECYGEPSGITASLANVWVIVIPSGPHNGLWMVRLDRLRAAVENIKAIPAGDSKAARIKLLPIGSFIRIATRLEEAA